MKRSGKKKPEKLKKEEKRLANEFIGEEIRTRKYGRRQAIAIGISRAKARAKELREIAKKHGIR